MFTLWLRLIQQIDLRGAANISRRVNGSIIDINALKCLSYNGCAMPFINDSPAMWVVLLLSLWSFCFSIIIAF